MVTFTKRNALVIYDCCVVSLFDSYKLNLPYLLEEWEVYQGNYAS